jgi:hypothetical protein
LWNIWFASLLEQAKHGTEKPHRSSSANLCTEIELKPSRQFTDPMSIGLL